MGKYTRREAIEIFEAIEEFLYPPMTGWVKKFVHNRIVAATTGTQTYGCRVIRTTTQSIPKGDEAGYGVVVSFDTEIHDVGNCWNIANPTRMVAPVAGYYCAGGGHGRDWDQVIYTGRRHVIDLWTNGGYGQSGAESLARLSVPTVASQQVMVAISTGMFYLGAGEYVEVQVYHDDGDGGQSLNIMAATTVHQGRCFGFLQGPL